MSGPRGDRRTWFACALIVVTVLALHHEVIFGGLVYHMDDAADGYYPCHVAITRAYRHFQLPDWERGAATGWPLVVDPYYGPFYPLGALFGIFGAARGLGVQIVLHTILCGFGAQTEEAQRRFQEELAVEVEPARSPLGIPGENNAGLLGYLRSIAKNN